MHIYIIYIYIYYIYIYQAHATGLDENAFGSSPLAQVTKYIYIYIYIYIYVYIYIYIGLTPGESPPLV